MIRGFIPSVIALLKLDCACLSAVEIIKEFDKHFNISNARCPNCGTKGHLKLLNQTYNHNLVDYIDGKLQEATVEIRQVFCSKCPSTSTHCILPDIFIPHKSYSIIFIIKFLKAYTFRHGETVEAICKRFGISTSTYSAWKTRYISHMQLYLDKIQKYLLKKDPYLTGSNDNASLSDFLCKFLERFGFSFLQYKNLKTTHYGGAPESAAFTGV